MATFYLSLSLKVVLETIAETKIGCPSMRKSFIYHDICTYVAT